MWWIDAQYVRQFKKKDHEITISDYEPARKELRNKENDEVLCDFPIDMPDKEIWQVFNVLAKAYKAGVEIGKRVQAQKIRDALYISNSDNSFRVY